MVSKDTLRVCLRGKTAKTAIKWSLRTPLEIVRCLRTPHNCKQNEYAQAKKILKHRLRRTNYAHRPGENFFSFRSRLEPPCSTAFAASLSRDALSQRGTEGAGSRFGRLHGAHRPRLHHQVVLPLYQGETSETMTADCLWA